MAISRRVWCHSVPPKVVARTTSSQGGSELSTKTTCLLRLGFFATSTVQVRFMLWDGFLGEESVTSR
jgi:hypothetical protein